MGNKETSGAAVSRGTTTENECRGWCILQKHCEDDRGGGDGFCRGGYGSNVDVVEMAQLQRVWRESVAFRRGTLAAVTLGPKTRSSFLLRHQNPSGAEKTSRGLMVSIFFLDPFIYFTKIYSQSSKFYPSIMQPGPRSLLCHLMTYRYSNRKLKCIFLKISANYINFIVGKEVTYQCML